jgi:hypothetical protein
MNIAAFHFFITFAKKRKNMEASTTLRDMLAGNTIAVPTYQRAYSWEVQNETDGYPKQVNTFLSDLEQYNDSSSKTPYYFGHFLFEGKENDRKSFGVIDGQQRLTTIIIFLSALRKRLKQLRIFTEAENELYEDMVQRNSTYRFSTVEYDEMFFKDYVINQTKNDRIGCDTISANRIADAFDFFSKCLINKDEDYITHMIDTIQQSSCTTHIVTDEAEAIQMFIFQNNRGKAPSHLEIIKAQFMFTVHLYAKEEDKNDLIDEIKCRFEKIYKAISSIENYIYEDDVLTYTLRVYFNSLWEQDAMNRIGKEISKGNSILFIKQFTEALSGNFDYLLAFFVRDMKNIQIHSLITLGGIGIAIPFVLKAYKFNLPIEVIAQLCESLESLILRDKIIGTRADITSRISRVYQEFTPENHSIAPIVMQVKDIKSVNSENWWWAHWNNDAFKKALRGRINSSLAKYILWKYENYLIGNKGYAPIRFDSIECPELEHIAPQTPPNTTPIAAGYCEYDDEFKELYLDSIGNYLLLSKSQNCSIGNKPFPEKRATYVYLYQQREIQKMTKDDMVWDKAKIECRESKIIEYVIGNL